jgi:23S rRNA pseudouridine1911/1915/1917 synthase
LCGPSAFSVKQVLKEPVMAERDPPLPVRVGGVHPGAGVRSGVNQGVHPAQPAQAPPREAVPPELAGPLDRAVRGLFGVSWGKARTWIEGGKVSVDGARTTASTARVAAGAVVALNERAARMRGGELADGDVVHVDAQVVVVEKPAGLSTIPYDDTEVDTLESRVRLWLERRLERRSKTRGGRPTLGVVHRIDKETSGLVVFTRTWLAKQSLSSQFRQHTVHRRYLALAHGDVRSRTVRTFLVDDRGDGLRGSARGTPPTAAREAITHIERLEGLGSVATLVACRLETGRTHQIRIHLSESGHPVVGEKVYARRFSGTLLDAPRLMLHAAELGFVHPSTENEVRWERPMPADMAGVLERLRAAGK